MEPRLITHDPTPPNEPQQPLLACAARLQQLKLTEFMLKSSQAAAESTLAERTRFMLSPEKWRKFNAALDAPARQRSIKHHLVTFAFQGISGYYRKIIPVLYVLAVALRRCRLVWRSPRLDARHRVPSLVNWR